MCQCILVNLLISRIKFHTYALTVLVFCIPINLEFRRIFNVNLPVDWHTSTGNNRNYVGIHWCQRWCFSVHWLPYMHHVVINIRTSA